MDMVMDQALARAVVMAVAQAVEMEMVTVLAVDAEMETDKTFKGINK